MDFLDIKLHQIVSTSQSVIVSGSLYTGTTVERAAAGHHPAHLSITRKFVQAFTATLDAGSTLETIKADILSRLNAYNPSLPQNKRFKPDEIFI